MDLGFHDKGWGMEDGGVWRDLRENLGKLILCFLYLSFSESSATVELESVE